MVKDHSDSERGNLLPPHELLFPISSKDSFICTSHRQDNTAFVTPVVEHWLEREIAQWVHSIKDRSADPSHHERTLLPRSYLSLHESVEQYVLTQVTTQSAVPRNRHSSELARLALAHAIWFLSSAPPGNPTSSDCCVNSALGKTWKTINEYCVKNHINIKLQTSHHSILYKYHIIKTLTHNTSI